MKKCYYFLMVMLLALVAVGVTSCGDDDEPKYSSDIIGTWSLNTDYLSDAALYFKFTKDGKFYEVQTSFPDGVESLVDVFRGTYTISGNVLTITYHFEYEDETVECLYEVKNGQLTLTFEGEGELVTATFTRVKDSVIDPYL